MPAVAALQPQNAKMASPAQIKAKPIIAMAARVFSVQKKRIAAAKMPMEQAAREANTDHREITTAHTDMKREKTTAAAAMSRENQTGDPSTSRRISQKEKRCFEGTGSTMLLPSQPELPATWPT